MLTATCGDPCHLVYSDSMSLPFCVWVVGDRLNHCPAGEQSTGAVSPLSYQSIDVAPVRSGASGWPIPPLLPHRNTNADADSSVWPAQQPLIRLAGAWPWVRQMECHPWIRAGRQDLDPSLTPLKNGALRNPTTLATKELHPHHYTLHFAVLIQHCMEWAHVVNSLSVELTLWTANGFIL